MTELWEPSEENYELEIRETFPPETVDLILGELDQYAIDLLEDLGVVEGDQVLESFLAGLSGQPTPLMMLWIIHSFWAWQIITEKEISILNQYRRK